MYENQSEVILEGGDVSPLSKLLIDHSFNGYEQKSTKLKVVLELVAHEFLLKIESFLGNFSYY